MPFESRLSAWSPGELARAAAFASLLSVATACARGTRSPAPDPASSPATFVERFPRPHEVIVADSSDTYPVGRRPNLYYPAEAMSRGIEAAFGTIFIIDTTGRVEMPSVTFITETPNMFRVSVCDFVKEVRFYPVKQDKIARRAALVMPWVFAHSRGKLLGHRMDARMISSSLKQRGVAAYVPELDTLPHCPERRQRN